MVGTPFGYHKFKGGLESSFVGFQLHYDRALVGISVSRGTWIVEWIKKVSKDNFVVPARDFSEFLGRLGFISQLLIWLKPHLSPLFAWSAAVAGGTVGRLPDTVILTLQFILAEFELETFLVAVRRPLVFPGEMFRTDAKCTDEIVVLGGWDLRSKAWFSLKLFPADVPFLFKENKGSQWASTSAELLASLVALHAFGWLKPGPSRKTVVASLTAGTDNRANEFLTEKRSTTKWPLMAINMQMSASLSKSRLSLTLSWRPRNENTEADNLTNEIFTDFKLEDRISLSLRELDLSILDMLVESRDQFDKAKLHHAYLH